MTRPFRFAVQTGPFDDLEALGRHARMVESLGYHELFGADHIGRGSVDPFVPLVAAAAATTSLRVGPLVLNNEFHHPALLARTILSVDQMTAGRLVLGLGTGYAQSEHDAIGLELRPPGQRVDRFAESLTVLRQLLDTGSCSFHGDHHRVEVDDLGLRPLQDHVPFLIGGHGPRVVRLAAQFADVFQFTGLVHGTDGTPSGAGFGIDHLDLRARWLTEAAGDRDQEIERSALVQFTALGTDVPTIDDMSARFGLPHDVFHDTPFVLAGSEQQVVDKLERLRERLGISHVVVRDAEGFASIVDALAGH